jgi:LysM repeat protein
MNRKNIIIVTAVANAALLLILFISAVVSREDKKTLASAEVASSILEKNPDGMVLLSQENEHADLQKKEGRSPLASSKELAAKELIPKELVPLALNEANSENGALQPTEPMHKLPEVALQDNSTDPVLVNPPEEKLAETKTFQEKKESFVEVVVKKGDSLDKLARRHHTSIQEIKKTNHLEGSFLQVGKKLRIPLQKEVAQKIESGLKSEKNIADSAEYYVIKHGDNPWTVAIKHHLKVEELLRLNHLSKEKAKKLRPGDKLRIR